VPTPDNGDFSTHHEAHEEMGSQVNLSGIQNKIGFLDDILADKMMESQI